MSSCGRRDRGKSETRRTDPCGGESLAGRAEQTTRANAARAPPASSMHAHTREWSGLFLGPARDEAVRVSRLQ